MNQFQNVPGPSQDDFNALNTKLTNYVISQTVSLGNTGSVGPGETVTLTKAISSFCPEGYKVLSVSPGYTGDNQFCWNSCGFNSNEISGIIRNVSTAADSGTMTVIVLFVKT